MRKFEAKAPLTVSAGAVLGLSAEQAARRALAIKRLPDGSYIVERPTMFKAGEVFGYDGDLPKALASLVEAKGRARVSAPPPAPAAAPVASPPPPTVGAPGQE